MDAPSRIELANRRLRTTRIAVGLTAATAFVVFGAAARAAHPGSSHALSAKAVSTGSDDSNQSQYSFDFGNGSVGTSTGGSPAIQSGGS